MTPQQRESYGDLIDRLHFKVKDHMKWSDDQTNRWFRNKNPLCGNLTPDEFIARRPEKAEKWIDSLVQGEGP